MFYLFSISSFNLNLGGIYLSESGFLETTFQTFMYLFVIRKVGQQKTLTVKKKIDLIFKKVFSFYFERKTLFRSCEKFRNIILFVDYIKFGPQAFY